MADKNSTSPKGAANAGSTSGPASAPELTDEQKRQIESELNVSRQAEPKSEPIELRTKTPQPRSDQAGVPADEAATKDAAPQPVHAGRFKRFFAGYWRRKKWTLPLTLLALLGGLAIATYLNDSLSALILPGQQFKVTVMDQATDKPVSSADVSIDGKTAKTDKDGKAVLNGVEIGHRNLTVSKKYYKSDTTRIYVSFSEEDRDVRVDIEATGRQVPISVVNKVTGKPLENVTLKASGTEVKTDGEGKAVIVLPADKTDLPISLSNGGYNSLNARIAVTEAVEQNTFKLTPSGKLYFLSRQSGKIDVVKTDLDGANRQTVVYGTGREDDRNTVLLASRDWKFLALHSKRDSSPAKLYLIDTSSDKMTEIDAGDANFQLVGWNDHDFVYRVQRNAIKYWQPNYLALKSYNADKKQILTLDQSLAEGDETNSWYQTFGNPYIVEGKLVYTVGWEWYGSNYFNRNPAGRNHSVRVASVNSQSKKDVRTWPADQFSAYFQASLYNPRELYYSVYSNAAGKEVFYEYENGAIKDAAIEPDKFQIVYPTYLASPSGDKTLYKEQRDGRDTFFVGDKNGDNGKQIAVLDEFEVYGWYSDDYVLAAKKGSELHIMPVAGLDGEAEPLKVADYHKPQQVFRGYGGGYGGL